MKKLLFVLIVAASSCSVSKIMPLTETYPTTPIIFNSDQNFEKTWDKLVDVFAQKGLSIRIIDKSSGIIISQKSLLSATTETKAGGLLNPSAYIAVPYYMSGKNRIPITAVNVGPYVKAKDIPAPPVYGDWNVRIKTTPTGSVINVNITDIYFTYYDVKLKDVKSKELKAYRSTGVFEKDLSDLVK